MWLKALGYAVLRGPDIATGVLGAERGDLNYRDVVLEARLCQALVRPHSHLPRAARRDAVFLKLSSRELRVRDAGRLPGREC